MAKPRTFTPRKHDAKEAEFEFQPLPSAEAISCLTPSAQKPIKTTLLRRSKFAVVSSVVLIIAPLIFIVPTIMAAALDGKPGSYLGNHLQEALLLGPTLFPIVFAAVCGHMMTSIATFHSQAGLELRVLEHLIGAQSMFSALERFILSHNFGVFGFLITFVWALSPLGGQALLRMAAPGASRSFWGNSTACYLSPEAIGSNLQAVTPGASDFASTQEMYLTTLTLAASYGSVYKDPWSFPKLPSSLQLEQAQMQAQGRYSSEEWIGINTWFALGSTEEFWTNLLGLPMRSPDFGSYSDWSLSWSFNTTTIDMEISCLSSKNTTVSAFVDSLDEAVLENGTATTNISIGLQSTESTSFIYATNSSFQSFLDDSMSKIAIFYGSKSGTGVSSSSSDTPISLTQCDLSVRSLECEIQCLDTDYCDIERARAQPYNFTKSQYETMRAVLTNGAFTNLVLGNTPNRSSYTDLFLYDPNSTIGHTSSYVNLATVDPEVLGRRLTIAFNTFLWASSSLAWKSDWSCDKWKTEHEAVAEVPMRYFANTIDVFGVDKKWLSIAFIVTFLLEAMAITSAILTFRTRVPDVFGYVSTMTMDNRYCDAHGLAQSTALGGQERAAILGKVKFMLADVRSDDGIGHIALVPVGDDGVVPLSPDNGMRTIGRVRHQRLYD